MKASLITAAKGFAALTLLFNSAVQACTLNGWSSTQDTAGNLSAAASARYTGSCGFISQMNGTSAAFVEDNSPSLVTPAVNQYRLRFYLFVDSLQMDAVDELTLLSSQAADQSPLFSLKLSQSTGNNYLDLAMFNDQGTAINPTGKTQLRDGWRAIELVWAAANSTGSNNGSVSLYIDNQLKQTISGIDNDTHRVGAVRLGSVAGNSATVSGRIDFDDFKSQRTQSIGLIQKSCQAQQAALVVDNTTFLPGSANCIATNNIQMGSRVTVDSGTTLSVQAPNVQLTNGFRALSGANLTIGQ